MENYFSKCGYVFCTVGDLQELLKPYPKGTQILVDNDLGLFYIDTDCSYLNLGTALGHVENSDQHECFADSDPQEQFGF